MIRELNTYEGQATSISSGSNLSPKRVCERKESVNIPVIPISKPVTVLVCLPINSLTKLYSPRLSDIKIAKFCSKLFSTSQNNCSI